MLFIPQKKTIVILVPRTGSGSLWRAAKLRYSDAKLAGRHLEADAAVPEFANWRIVGLIRHPVHRLYSLWQFLGDLPAEARRLYPEWAAQQMESVRGLRFAEWIVANETVFANGVVTTGNVERHFPAFRVNYPMPETKKSQLIYLQPEIAGTEILAYETDYLAFATDLDLEPQRFNMTAKPASIAAPLLRELPIRARAHVQHYFAGDIEVWEAKTGRKVD
jgi:hypothetical protein